MMLHAFLGFLRVTWADCWDYDQIKSDELIESPAYHPYCGLFSWGKWDPRVICVDYSLGLDDRFVINPLANGL